MYMLTKPDNPKFTKIGVTVFWIEFDSMDKFKDKHKTPQVGYSLIMDPYSAIEFTWYTTPITEILEDTTERTHFKTQNSEYILYKP
jgi:hypothetical protein